MMLVAKTKLCEKREMLVAMVAIVIRDYPLGICVDEISFAALGVGSTLGFG